MREWRLILVTHEPLDPVMGLPLAIPIELARGRYEDLTDEQLQDHKDDIAAESQRREDERA